MTAPRTIKIRKDGAYVLDLTEGPIALVDHEGNPVPLPEGKTTIALCRCGASTRKPFCDGMHSKIGFRGAEQARVESEAGTDATGGAAGAGGGSTGGGAPVPPTSPA